MRVDDLQEVVAECRRLMDRIKSVKARGDYPKILDWGCKETAAIKRASLDLNNALVKLRNSK